MSLEANEGPGEKVTFTDDEDEASPNPKKTKISHHFKATPGAPGVSNKEASNKGPRIRVASASTLGTVLRQAVDAKFEEVHLFPLNYHLATKARGARVHSMMDDDSYSYCLEENDEEESLNVGKAELVGLVEAAEEVADTLLQESDSVVVIADNKGKNYARMLASLAMVFVRLDRSNVVDTNSRVVGPVDPLLKRATDLCKKATSKTHMRAILSKFYNEFL